MGISPFMFVVLIRNAHLRSWYQSRIAQYLRLGCGGDAVIKSVLDDGDRVVDQFALLLRHFRHVLEQLVRLPSFGVWF